MKRILCLIDVLGYGGAERQMIGLARLLKSKGYYVDLVCYTPHDFSGIVHDKYGLDTKTLVPEPNKLGKLLAVKRQIKREKYDSVIAYKGGPVVIGCLLRLMGMRFQLIVSERIVTQVVNKNERVKFFLYKWADYIVPNSYAQESFIKENFPSLSKKIVTITNFTDTKVFNPQYETSNNKLVMLTTARIVRQKNILLFLDAVKTIKEKGLKIEFKWFGDENSLELDYDTLVKKKVKDLGLDDIITFHPAITEINKEYQNCDVYCLPSCYEGYPNVVCEAMSCGKPILCSRVCDNPAIVEEGVNGYMFDPRNVDDIVEKIEKIYHLSNEERIKMGHKSREISEKKFSEEAFVNKYVQLIES